MFIVPSLIKMRPALDERYAERAHVAPPELRPFFKRFHKHFIPTGGLNNEE